MLIGIVESSTNSAQANKSSASGILEQPTTNLSNGTRNSLDMTQMVTGSSQNLLRASSLLGPFALKTLRGCPLPPNHSPR